MSERVIAKEHLPELSAWQAFSFDPPSLREMPVKVPTASEIEAMHQAARDEGYSDGVAQAKDELMRLAALNNALASHAQAFEGEIAEAVLSLALTRWPARWCAKRLRSSQNCCCRWCVMH